MRRPGGWCWPISKGPAWHARSPAPSASRRWNRPFSGALTHGSKRVLRVLRHVALRSLLFQASERDPCTFIAIALAFTCVGVVASALPPRRATRVDPIVALRTEQSHLRYHPVVALPATAPEPELTTLADLPFHVLGRHPKPLLVGRAVGTTIEGASTRDWFERLRDLSLGLSAFGVASGDRVAIVSESRPEWLLADLALQVAGAVTVPIYPTLSAQQVQYILADSGARLAIVSNAEQLEKIQHVRHLLPRLEAILLVDGIRLPRHPCSRSPRSSSAGTGE